MIAVELYRPDELSLYSTGDKQDALKSFSEKKAVSAKTMMMMNVQNRESSDDSFKLDDEDDDIRQVNVDDENPYIKEKQQLERELGSKKSLRKRKSQKHHLKNGSDGGGENENISKMADMRVSNALIINNKLSSKKKDQFIKKILKDDNDIIKSNKKINREGNTSNGATGGNTNNGGRIVEAASEDNMSFDIENQKSPGRPQIEMTNQLRASDPLLNPLLDLDG